MLIAIAVAVIGGAVALAVGLASGALHTTKHATTVVEPAPASVPASGSPSAAWASVYARVAPGTVDITVQSTTSVNTPFGSTQQQETALGSGFVIDGSGHILTAAHVVTGATQVSVAFQNGVTRTAKILGEDDSSDVAVLQVEPAGLTLSPLALGSSQALEVGDAVGVIGDPLGFDRSLSTGVVSGIDRTIEAPDGFIIAHSIQTDAALNPGNSGGPLLDSGGRVIGIADQIATGTNQFGRSTAETSSGVGFAVPIDLAKVELSRLKRGEPVTHAYLGVSTAATTSAGQQGALIAGVQPGTPAAKAGLAAGDVIVAFNGMAIHGANDLIDALAAAHVGVKVKITVLRGTSRLTFTVTLAAQPAHPASE
jgi:putative serine protease PepD